MDATHQSSLKTRTKLHPSGYREISPEEALKSRASLRVIDVRQPAEYVGELGHMPGAELLPLEQVQQAVAGWDRHQPLLVVCRSGARSGNAAAWLAGLGFAEVYNLVGGMMAWNADHLPIER